MKIILLRDKGVHRSVQISRRVLAVAACFSAALCLAAVGAFSLHLTSESVDAAVVAQWQQKLLAQRAELEALQRKSQLQSAAVGRQLASMQAPPAAYGSNWRTHDQCG